MILANVGLQIYNNWCGSRQNSRLQQKREEFEQAARERNKERMWKIMREGQELTLSLEEEKHRQRLDELRNDIGNLLQKMAYTAAISNWPLSVLPIVMKNQALGNLLANQEESIAMHCIFTPSNSHEFNKHVFPLVEKSLEQYCNRHWSIMGDHPVLFYSGAWQAAAAPTEVQIDSMRTALGNLPTLLITPFFRPGDGRLIFQLRMWGVGASSNDNVYFSDMNEFEPAEFQRTYTDKDDYVNETGLLDEIVEDIVPYLECLIGYMADTYFWSALGLAPCLPGLLVNGAINTDGMKYLMDESRKYYDRLLLTGEEYVKVNPFVQDNLLNLYKGCAELWDDKNKKNNIESIFLLKSNIISHSNFTIVVDAIKSAHYSYNDVLMLEELKFVSEDPFLQKLIDERISQIQCKVQSLIVESDDLFFDDILMWCNDKVVSNIDIKYISIEILENKVVVAMLDGKKNYIHNEHDPMCCVFNYKRLIISDFVVIKSRNLMLSTSRFLFYYNQIIK
jgi:hypothetical protein